MDQCVYMDGKISIPIKLLTNGQLEEVKRLLTYKRHMLMSNEPQIIRDYAVAKEGTVYLPRNFGIAWCKKHKIEINYKFGKGRIVHPKHALRRLVGGLRPKQKPLVEECIKVIRKGKRDFIIKAHTGAGKTVIGLDIARRLGRAVLIIVDQETIRDGWIKTAKGSTHFKLDDKDIGVIQGDKWDYKGKTVVVAMIQTLFRKRHRLRRLNGLFGLALVDECPKTAAPCLSKVMFGISAPIRIGLSATPSRKDVLHKVLFNHLGDVSVTLDQKHAKSIVRVLQYRGNAFSWYSNVSKNTGRFVSEVATDPDRNRLIIAAVRKLYDKGRDILVISERIHHLEELMSLAKVAGIPDDDIGLCAGKETRWVYAKDPTPKYSLRRFTGDCMYTPVKLTRVEKRRPKKKNDYVLENAQIIFATYHMLSTGANIPRLSAGIEATPKSDITQAHGRILRQQKGKSVPVWVSLWDVNSYRSQYQFCKRIKSYVKESNAEIYLWSVRKGVKKIPAKQLLSVVEGRVAKLRKGRIEINAGGRYIPVM